MCPRRKKRQGKKAALLYWKLKPTAIKGTLFLTRRNTGPKKKWKNTKRDPILQVQATILKNKFATQADLDAINKRIEDTVTASVKFAEESPWPNDDEVLKDVYVDQNYPFIVD